MRKERTNIYITERQKKQLEQRSRAENLPIAELIRRAVDCYLAWDDPTYALTQSTPKKEAALHPPHE
jgi:hypothetical protein